MGADAKKLENIFENVFVSVPNVHVVFSQVYRDLTGAILYVTIT